MTLPLAVRALGGLAFLTMTLFAAIFIPAGTHKYWQGWAYLAVFITSTLVITLRLFQVDRALLERRMSVGAKAEKRARQKVIQFLAQFVFLSLLVIPAIDHRLGWSTVPKWTVATGDLLVLIGMCVVYNVFRENSYASATIETNNEHIVISTGLYAWIRHPMYSGGLLLMAGTPIALGSWWGLPAMIPMTTLIVLRLLDEERFLLAQLPGYGDYCRKVPKRLIPGIF